MIPAAALRWSPGIRWSPAIRWSIRSMGFDKPKVYGDTSITDGLVFFKVPLQAPHSLYVICAESSGNSRDVCCLQFQSLFWVQVILLKYLYQIDIIAYENFLTNSSSLSWQLDQSGQRWDISKFSDSKISSEMEVAPCYSLLTFLTVFTLFILFKLLYTA